jgi:N-dimethylarginine dimethylaminohydrolase
LWLDERTLAVGRGYRSNAEGIRQLSQVLPEVEVVTVPLPHFRGPSDVFHLMSIVSPVDNDVAVVYSPLMPVPFRELLLERRITLVEVPEAEYDALGCNVLTVSPRVCVVAEGAPETRRRMESHGIEVHTFQASEICVAGSGGPTCLTRTLERDV